MALQLSCSSLLTSLKLATQNNQIIDPTNISSNGKHHLGWIFGVESH